MPDVDVHRARVAVGCIAPHRGQQVRAREHPARRARECREDLELHVGQLDLFPADRHDPPREIDEKLAGLDRLVCLGGVREFGAAHECARAASELPDRKRLGDVVVGSDLEAEDLVSLVAASGEHDDRHLAAASKATADLDSVDSRQHHVENHEVEALGRELVQGLPAVQGGHHLVAVTAKRIGEERLNRLLVVDQQHSGDGVGHALKATVEGAPPVVDLRLYRASFLPALAALGALLFSLQSLPAALEPLVSPGTFDGQAASHFARQVAAVAPSRPPGSEGDMRVADLVQRTFRSVRGGDILEQSFSATAGGDDVPMKNVILRLPGRSDRTVAVIASRDSITGPGAATSAAATGALMEMAVELGGVTHGATLILASTDGGTAGEAGAKELASGLLDDADVEGVVALAAPGLEQPQAPFLIDTSDGPERGGVQLERTAERALADQAQVHVARPGPVQQLVRLAIPWGLGEQAPLIERGIDAVTVTAGGELPVSAAAAETLDPATLTRFARSALDVVLSLDSAPTVDHGPSSYIEVGGNIVPGWAVGVLALALILPALVAAVDALARAARQGEASTALRWGAPRALPFVAALALVYLFALIGIVTRPSFPFEPRSIGLGFGEVVVMLIVAGAAFGAWRFFGGNALPANLDGAAAASALGLMLVADVLLIWAFNPFLALLITPLAHVWVPQARETARSTLRSLLAVAIGLLPLLLALASVASRLHPGIAIPWQALVAVGDWGLDPIIALAMTLGMGWLAALVLAARA